MNSGVAERVRKKGKQRLDHPEMYRVILYNDNFTAMEFVVDILVKIFSKPIVEATTIMLQVHKSGKGIVGAYTYDVASTKVRQVRELANQYDFPLRCTIERA